MAQVSAVLGNHVRIPETQGQSGGGAGLPPERHIAGADGPGGERTQEEHDAAVLADMTEQMENETVQPVNPGIHMPDIIGNLIRRSSRAPYLGATAVGVWGERVTVRREVPFVLNANGEFSRLN